MRRVRFPLSKATPHDSRALPACGCETCRLLTQPRSRTRLRRWCMKNRRCAFTLWVRGLFDTNGDRHAKVDCQLRINPLTAPHTVGRRVPCGDGFVGHPHCQASSPDQSRVIIRPVRHPLSGLGNLVATTFVEFVRHWASQSCASEGKPILWPDRQPHHPSDARGNRSRREPVARVFYNRRYIRAPTRDNTDAHRPRHYRSPVR